MNFETIKRNFDRKLWTAPMILKAVEKGIITPEQYTEITTFTYPSTQNDEVKAAKPTKRTNTKRR